MEGKDKISDKYRQEVEKLLDDKYGFDPSLPLNREEQDEIWDEISAEIDIDEIWNNISSDLDTLMPADSGSGILIKSVAVVLVILLGIIPVSKTSFISGTGPTNDLMDTIRSEQPEMHKTEDNTLDFNKEDKIKGDISPKERSSYNENELENTDNNEELKETGPGKTVPIHISNEVEFSVLAVTVKDHANLFPCPEEIPFEKFNIPPALFYENLEEIRVSSKTDLNSLKSKERATNYGLSLPVNEGGMFSAGFTTLIRNTWLLNHETYKGLKSESLNTTEIVFFPDIALSLNYSLNKTWSLQADGFFCSNTGQDYLDYIYGHYSRKSITLRYSTIALSVKYKFNSGRIPANHSSVNLFAGAYLSFLNQAHQKINEDLENIRTQYVNFDFGIRSGGEIEFHLTDRISLAPGLFVSLGIPNIYRGDGYIPGYFRKTRNGSAGFQLTFYHY